MFDAKKFIHCVQLYPAIWQVKAPHSRERAEREKCWVAVAELMFPSWFDWSPEERDRHITMMKEKWRHIRDSYTKYVKQYNVPVPRKNTYIYEEDLTFLLDTIVDQKPRYYRHGAYTLEDEDEADNEAKEKGESTSHPEEDKESGDEATPEDGTESSQQPSLPADEDAEPVKKKRIRRIQSIGVAPSPRTLRSEVQHVSAEGGASGSQATTRFPRAEVTLADIQRMQGAGGRPLPHIQRQEMAMAEIQRLQNENSNSPVPNFPRPEMAVADIQRHNVAFFARPELALPDNQRMSGEGPGRNVSFAPRPGMAMSDIYQNDEDGAARSFLLSLLPDYKKLDDEQKLDFRLHALQFFKNIRSGQKSS